MRWAIAATLAECGHRVVEAADSAAAIRALTDGTAAPDVMLVDCRLSSDSDDLSLIATLRRLSPKSAVVLMTAFGTREVVEDVQALGVCHVMHKPFDLRDIACAVEHAQDRERRTSRVRRSSD